MMTRRADEKKISKRDERDDEATWSGKKCIDRQGNESREGRGEEEEKKCGGEGRG